MGAILVFAMHGGFAFLEVGTVRHKNQVNALVKILVDFAISTTAYFAIGYTLAYGVSFLASARDDQHRPGLSPGQILLPRHVRGRRTGDHFGRHRRARQIHAAVCGDGADGRVGLSADRRRGLEQEFGLQDDFFNAVLGAPFKDFAGSIVVHAFGGWAALAAVLQLGARIGRYDAAARSVRRHLRSRGWRWVRGCCASAGSASTS